MLEYSALVVNVVSRWHLLESQRCCCSSFHWSQEVLHPIIDSVIKISFADETARSVRSIDRSMIVEKKFRKHSIRTKTHTLVKSPNPLSSWTIDMASWCRIQVFSSSNVFKEEYTLVLSSMLMDLEIDDTKVIGFGFLTTSKWHKWLRWSNNIVTHTVSFKVFLDAIEKQFFI